MQDTILSVSGRPGLYKLVAHGHGTLIVESISPEKQRITAGVRDRVTSLNDVSMYTDEEDMPLMQVFENIKNKYNSAKVDLNYKKASKDELAKFMEEVLPNYDKDRVYTNDIKKLIQWYNILIENGYTEFADKKDEETETEKGETADK